MPSAPATVSSTPPAISSGKTRLLPAPAWPKPVGPLRSQLRQLLSLLREQRSPAARGSGGLSVRPAADDRRSRLCQHHRTDRSSVSSLSSKATAAEFCRRIASTVARSGGWLLRSTPKIALRINSSPKIFGGWIGAVRSECVEQIKDRSPAGTDRDALATYVLAVMEGGVMLSRSYGSVDPFDHAVRQLRQAFSTAPRSRTRIKKSFAQALTCCISTPEPFDMHGGACQSQRSTRRELSPLEHDALLRKQLISLYLTETNAHAGFEDAVKDIPVKLRGEVPKGAEHSPWQLLEHLRIAQWDILDFSRNPDYETLKWPDEYWPKSPEPPTEKSWDQSVHSFRH